MTRKEKQNFPQLFTFLFQFVIIITMRTISQVVEEIVQRSPFLVEIMAEGLANNANIARRIKGDVEKRLLEKVSEQSIAMALHRLSKTVRRPIFGTRFLKKMSDITVRSNLVEVICPNSVNLHTLLKLISRSADKEKDTFVNFSRGLHESLLIVNKELEHTVLKALEGEKGVRSRAGLSAITLRLPEGSLNVPGVYHPILGAVAREGISFVEVMSVNTEFSIIFEDKDVDRAFSVIKRLTTV